MVAVDTFVTVLAMSNDLHRSFTASRSFIVGPHVENPGMNTWRSEENWLSSYNKRSKS